MVTEEQEYDLAEDLVRIEELLSEDSRIVIEDLVRVWKREWGTAGFTHERQAEILTGFMEEIDSLIETMKKREE